MLVWCRNHRQWTFRADDQKGAFGMSLHTPRHTARRFSWRRNGSDLVADLPHAAFRLSIRARLWLGFGIVIAMSSIIVGLTTIQSSMLAATLQDLNTKDLPEVITLGHLHTAQTVSGPCPIRWGTCTPTC